VAELREKVLPGKTINSLQPSPGGKGLAVMQW